MTWTLTIPDPAGLVTVSWVSLWTEIPVPVVVPKYTVVAPVKFLPVSVTSVPPEGGPAFGWTAVTLGTGSWTLVRNASVIATRFQNTGTLLAGVAVPSEFQLSTARGQIRVRGPSGGWGAVR